MSSLDLTFNEFCPNCKKEIEFDADFYIMSDDEDGYDSLNHICEHCDAEMKIEARIYIDRMASVKITKVSVEKVEEDEPYHSNDPSQLSLL